MSDDRDAIVVAAVRCVRARLGSETAFAALRDPDGAYSMRIVDGVREPAFREIRVAPGRGLGGRVLDVAHAVAVADYQTDGTISSDFRPVVAREGLHGIGCVPVLGPNGVDVLLYFGLRSAGTPSDRAMQELEDIAEFASIGLYHIAARARERDLSILRDRYQSSTELHDSIARALLAIGSEARAGELDEEAEAAERLRRIAAISSGARRELRDALARLWKAPSSVASESPFEAGLRRFEHRVGGQARVTHQAEPRSVPGPADELLIDGVREPRVRELVTRRDVDDALGELTRREREVLALIAEGCSNAGIGRRLWITESTVEKHMRSIMMKLCVPETDDVHRRVLAAVTFVTARTTF